MNNTTHHIVFIVGSDTYIGHNLGEYLSKMGIKVGMISVQESLPTQVCFHEPPMAVVFVPVLDTPKREHFFLEVLAQCDKHMVPRVILVSRDGVNIDSESVCSHHFAKLFRMEDVVFKLLQPKLAVIVRYGWILENFFWLVPYASHSSRAPSPLPIPTISIIRPVAVMDVVEALARLALCPLSFTIPCQHHQQVYTVTGPCDSQYWSYKSALNDSYFLRLCVNAMQHRRQETLLPNPDLSVSRHYGLLLQNIQEIRKRDFLLSPDPPLWPSGYELEMLHEFLRYANQEHTPAKRATDHLRRICGDRSRMDNAIVQIDRTLHSVELK